jgi:DNA polymerase/3'-5' exonuclease PolX
VSGKVRFPWAVATNVGLALIDALDGAVEGIRIAGSLRRMKPDVGDVELVFVPAMSKAGLFGDESVDMADRRIEGMLKLGILAKRPNVKGGFSWGAVNKLAVHVESGIPVDLFSTTREAFENYLVCRTGPAESNMAIASKAKAMGYRWNPYGVGFTRLADGEVFAMASERDVFEFVGLPFLSPEERGKR